MSHPNSLLLPLQNLLQSSWERDSIYGAPLMGWVCTSRSRLVVLRQDMEFSSPSRLNTEEAGEQQLSVKATTRRKKATLNSWSDH